MIGKLTFAVAMLASGSVFAQRDVYVAPRVDRDGQYHDGYHRSAPNQNRFDNYNAQNNQFSGSNPYTGQRGTQRDEFSNPPAYNRTSPSNPNPQSQTWGQQPQRRGANGW
jgi:hypothetical protein